MQFDESLADSAGPRETRDGAYRQREAFSPLDRTENVEVHHALHRRVLSALTFTPLFRGERPRTGHRPRPRARDGPCWLLSIKPLYYFFAGHRNR